MQHQVPTFSSPKMETYLEVLIFAFSQKLRWFQRRCPKFFFFNNRQVPVGTGTGKTSENTNCMHILKIQKSGKKIAAGMYQLPDPDPVGTGHTKFVVPNIELYAI